MLAKARQKVIDNGLQKADSLVKCFLKMETSTTLTDPRNISPRSDEFLATIGPYISALEHHLVDAPFLVKGMGLKDRDKKMTTLTHGHTFVESDYSRFDMTISEPWLRNVQDVLIAAYFHDEDITELATCLRAARRTKGVSDTGLCYNILGTRCSGDAHTSIGNGLINAFNTWTLLEVPHEAWHEGDDGIVSLAKPYASAANCLLNCDVFGFKVKLVISTNLADTTFCGRFFAVGNDGSLISYCDPLRTLSKFHISFSEGDAMTLLLAKVLSYGHTDSGTPIVGPICKSLYKLLNPRVTRKRLLMRNIKKGRFILADEKLSDITAVSWLDNDVPESTRINFCERTGMSPAEQERLEFAYSIMFMSRIPHSWTAPFLDDPDWGCDWSDRVVHYMPSEHSAR